MPELLEADPVAHVVDERGRALRDLRLSVTDRCNLRCAYCMSQEDYAWLPREDFLSFDELATLVAAAPSASAAETASPSAHRGQSVRPLRSVWSLVRSVGVTLWGRKSARESWSSPQQAYDAGVAAGQRGDFTTAIRATTHAEELFAARGDVEGRAGAARCAWRLANYQAAAGRAGEALAAGQRAVEVWTAVVDGSGSQVWNRELVRACADVSVFAVMAGRHDDAVALASRAVDVAQTARTKGVDLGIDMQTEMGTALHNLAAAHSARAVADGPPAGDRARDDLRAALRAADEEIRLRKMLAPVARPDLATWELASGLSQRGRIRMVAGELESARYDLRDARDLAARLGPAGQGIVEEAATVLQQLGGP